MTADPFPSPGRPGLPGESRESVTGHPGHQTAAQLTGCAIVNFMADGTLLPHPLPDQLAELIAQQFRVLGEPMRVKLLDALREGDATVHDLQDITGASQQNISKHLGVLLGAGLVNRVKDGNFSRYSIADDSVFGLCEQVCGRLRRQHDEREALLRAPSPQ
jgi:DNA-binding transcriptional ArsR family regulator